MDSSIYTAVPWDTTTNRRSTLTGLEGDLMLEQELVKDEKAVSSSLSRSSGPGNPLFDSQGYAVASASNSHDQYGASTSVSVTSITAAITAASNSLSVVISDPQKHGEGSSAFVSYLVSTRTCLPAFKSQSSSVRRRFQDFTALQKLLSDTHSACIIPPLPEKHRMEYITGDRFSSEFVEKRRISLQAYIDRIARHPILQQSPHVQRFLEAEQMSSYDHPRRESHVFENLGDVFLNAFSKVRKPDERFVDIKEAVEKFEQNLINVEKLHSRLLKHQTGLAADYLEFGSSITSLGMMETQVSQPLSNFGNRAPIFSQALTEKTVAEEQYYVNKLREYISYCQSVKDVLKARDQKQVEHEELTNWLLSHQVDRDRTMSTGKSPGITGFFKDKINDLKGVDPEKARQIRLVKLDAKIEELKDAVGQSSITAEAFSKQVVREIDGFQAVKIQDFNKHLQDYIDAQLVYHEKSMAFWEDMVPIADTVSLEEPHQSTSADGS
ncbi:hypothetical protein BATDEDRAFT_35712 [Batrachochytrium dendrobatidis JAM81]|uniref:Sorting nexin-4 n=2 Tax=Batrachochytrium dendrobatidis TaxID=109871 RepID=F4P879_BATDJ|nr:uncharacterized protein BATDEDRAFT_35712 [Batrachochytrium dendrobatidis JAM81]EGF78759.1 hypothetical protein BATDEDRAFT_35712 [Batrachochytrium dendrobatidis JAM81]KAK5664675.1 intercellular trafficking and secretion [Batrachochytrium dendrobatidis]OAJ43757.1 hypothetical protein BDEG_27085 [Batrachochytrium dendrobatidis JEL423]|eukprot:XP_006680798.1 hypothetical protein BATDEDRAFT_35712 [Batrachochytrium dendrobatidis JAM81]